MILGLTIKSKLNVLVVKLLKMANVSVESGSKYSSSFIGPLQTSEKVAQPHHMHSAKKWFSSSILNSAKEKVPQFIEAKRQIWAILLTNLSSLNYKDL